MACEGRAVPEDSEEAEVEVEPPLLLVRTLAWLQWLWPESSRDTGPDGGASNGDSDICCCCGGGGGDNNDDGATVTAVLVLMSSDAGDAQCRVACPA